MIVLDTNVISELMRVEPDPYVVAWVSAQDTLKLTLTTITVAEIMRGIWRLPEGKRQKDLQARFSGFVDEGFSGKLLEFDSKAAALCGEISALRENQGLNADMVDMMIAATVRAAGAKLATRNVTDFTGCGIDLINPWEL